MKDSVGLIGQGIEVIGDINFAGTLRIEGEVKGRINSSSGTVSIGETGVVEADIATNNCIVDGVLVGDLIASTRVEITRKGRIKGKVTTRDLVIAEGAIFEGNLEMTKFSKQDPSLSPKKHTQDTTQAA